MTEPEAFTRPDGPADRASVSPVVPPNVNSTSFVSRAEPSRRPSDTDANPITNDAAAGGRTSSGRDDDQADSPRALRRRRGGRARSDDGSVADGESSPVEGQSPNVRSGRSSRPDDDGTDSSELPPRSPRRSRARSAAEDSDRNPELPDLAQEGRPRSPERTAASLNDEPGANPRPRIGDTKPAPPLPGVAHGEEPQPSAEAAGVTEGDEPRRRRRGGRGRPAKKPATSGNAGTSSSGPIEQALLDNSRVQLDEKTMQTRRGKERNGQALGRYLMAVHVTPKATHIAVLEGRNLVEHYVSIPSDDATQIHGNIYLGKVQNVLPGMEAAFVDIGTPKNAVLYRGDVAYDPGEVEVGGGGNSGGGGGGQQLRIEQVLKARQQILCQVTKNPIAHKGARLTQEVSLPGRFVVLVPHSSTYGISKRLPDNERKRLRAVLDKVKPDGHGIIVRTAAENVTEEELRRDVLRLTQQWQAISDLAKRSGAPALLYREPDLALRVIREEFNADYRQISIDDPALFAEVRDYVRSISPALADRVEYYDRNEEPLPLFERFHVQEQLIRATDSKVWLPSGGSLIIEHTEALTVIDVNTGKNVGSRNLEDTVFHNNVEAAEEIARQLRLRDIGGIIVIDFVDMESHRNRDTVVRTFRESLSRDKTRTQVFEISELGLVEMTRKRIGEGLLESVSVRCDCCAGRGVRLDDDLIGEHAL